MAIKVAEETPWQFGLVGRTRVTPRLMRVVGVQLFHADMEPCAASMETESGPEHAHNGWPASSYEFLSTDLNREECQLQLFPALRLRGENRIVLTSLPFREYARIQHFSPSGIERLRLLDAEEATYHISCFNLEGPSQD